MEIVAEKRIQSHQYDQTIEATIVNTAKSDQGVYQVASTGAEFPAYGAASTYYKDEVVYVTIPRGDMTQQKFIIGRKIDPDSLPSTTFNFKMPFDDFVPLRNLTGEAPVTWNGSSISYTADKVGRWILKTDWEEIKAGRLHINNAQALHPIYDVEGNLTGFEEQGITTAQAHYITGDGEDINSNQNTIDHFKEAQAYLRNLQEKYDAKITVLKENYEEIIILFEDVNYRFQVDDDGNVVIDEKGHKVRDSLKYITNGEALSNSKYKLEWNGQAMSYLDAILNVIVADFSISANNMKWVLNSNPPNTLWVKVRDRILLPYMRKFIAGNYTKQKDAIMNNPNLSQEEKENRIQKLVNATSTSTYNQLIPYFAWDSTDLDAIKKSLKTRYETILHTLEEEFYSGDWPRAAGGSTHINYTDPEYTALYGSSTVGYSGAQADYSASLDEINLDNHNLLWTWKGKKSKNILIETKLGVSVDITTKLGEWLPQRGRYGLRFVITGLPKTNTEVGSLNSGSGHSVTEVINFTNDDMYGNTYNYYTPYTQQKILDISHLLTLDRIDCYFWQDFEFYDQWGNWIPPWYELTEIQDGQEVNVRKYVDPNIIFTDLKILVGITADEATTDRAIIYTYDEPAYGLSQTMQGDMSDEQLTQWRKGIAVREDDPKSNDTKKVLQLAWIHIDEKDGPVLINHETLKHAADKQSLQYWGAKLYWYKFNANYPPNDGVEADRLGGANWQPLERKLTYMPDAPEDLTYDIQGARLLEDFDEMYLVDNSIHNSSKTSTNTIIKAWHDAHTSWDYDYSLDNENLSITVLNDLGYLEQHYKAIVVIDSKTCRSETLTCTNRDATANSLDSIKLRNVILRFMRGKTTADGSSFVIDEDPGGGNFFVYDENNRVGCDESGVHYSAVPYYVQIWTLNKNNNTYQPASNDKTFGVTDIEWTPFGHMSMFESFTEPTNEEMQDSVLTPITGNMTEEQITWVKQITRKFYIRSVWDLSYVDNTIKVNMKYQGQPFVCEYECQFGQMGTMGSEYTIVVSQELPYNSPMIYGEEFQLVARVFKQNVEVPDTKYFFNWTIVSPTYTIGGNTPPSKASLKPLFDDNNRSLEVQDSYANDANNIHVLNNINQFWNRTYDRISVGQYQGNSIRGYICNDMPMIVKLDVDYAAGYTLTVYRAFNLVNDAHFSSNLTCQCPNRVEYKSDGSAPITDMTTFKIKKNYQAVDHKGLRNLTDGNNRWVCLFANDDVNTVYSTDSDGYYLTADGSRTTDPDKAAIIHDPILDDYIHPIWKLYAYSWDNEDWITTEKQTDPDTGEESVHTTGIYPHGGPNPDTNGAPGPMAGLGLTYVVGDGTQTEYTPKDTDEKTPIYDQDGELCGYALNGELDQRIVLSDGHEIKTSRWIDYKFGPSTNLNSLEQATIQNNDYLPFFTDTGLVYKGPESWHWDPAYSSKYYMFLTWKQNVYSPASWDPKHNRFTVKHTYWFRQAIALTQNLYSSSLLNSWDGSLLIDEANNAILAQMIAAGTKNQTNNTFTGVVMGDWAKRGDTSLDIPGLYGISDGEQVFGLRTNGTGYIGRSGKGRIEFDGNHGVIKNSDGTCFLNLDPIIIRYGNGDIGQRVTTGDLRIDNYQGFSQFFLYAEVKATTDTAGTEAGNFAWAENLMRYSKGITTQIVSAQGVQELRTDPVDLFVVDPSNGVLTTGGVYARYGRIGKYLLLNDAGISYMEGDTVDNRYFTTTYNLTNSENNNIIYIGQERRRDGSLITDTTNRNGVVVPAVREYDANYWSYLSYDKAYLEAHDPLYGREQNEVITQGSEKGRYIIWVGNIHPDTTTTLGAYPKFGVEHDGTVHMTEAYVQGEIHASALVIGDEDADEYDRNRGQKNFYSKVRKDHPEDILWQNPALLKKPLAGSNLYGVNSNGITGGTCRKHYGDWLRPGDTWYISSEAIPVVSQFQGRGANANAANPSYDNPYDLADTVVAITKYSITFNDNSGFQLQKIDKKDSEGNVIKEWVNKLDDDGHVMYDTNGNPIRIQQNVKIKQIVYTGDGNGIPYTKYTIETREAYLKQGKYFRETEKTVDSINVNELEDTLQANAQTVANQTKVVKAAETAYNNDKTANNLKTWNDAQNELQRLQCIYKTNQSKYDAIYSRLETWSKNINSTTDTALDKASYSASALIIEQLDNQQVSEESTDYPVPNPDSLGSADDAITSEGLSLQMSFTQLIWEGVQDEDDNHDWWGTWTSSNAGPSTREGSRILDSQLKVTDSDYNDGNDVPGLVHPKVLTKEIPSSNGTTSEPIVAKRYSAPPGWRVVGDVNNDSIWDALRHASLTFNRTLHSTTKLLTTNLRQSIADMMDKTGKSQKEALEELQRQRKELTNMLVHLQKDITDTVYNATADIRGGMDPITFFDDGNCYVFLTKYPIDSNISGIGMVPAGLTIAQLATQSPDNVASTFYLNSKRMGFYRTYKETLGGSEINITVPLLSYYNGTMALAGSLFFGMDYNNYIRGTGLSNNLIGNDGNLVDSTEHPEDFSYTNGTITIYKNYLDGPNSRIVLGNGAIILDGEDNGKDVDGNPNAWNPGTGTIGIQEKRKVNNKWVGTPYVYLGYGGITIDDQGNTIDSKYGQGVVRIGKKNGKQSAISITDFTFSANTNLDATVTLGSVEPTAALTPSDEISLEDQVITIDDDNLKSLFPDWSNIPTIYAITLSDTGVLKYYATSSSDADTLKLPDITDNYKKKTVYVDLSTSDTNYMYFTRTKKAGTGQSTGEGENEGYVPAEYTYSNPVYYQKTSESRKKLSYQKFVDALGSSIDTSSTGQQSVTLSGYKATYSLTVYTSNKIIDNTTTMHGDQLKIIQNTTSNGRTGLALFADNEGESNSDGYVVLAPWAKDKGWYTNGFRDTVNNLHWLVGWNFKGYSILAHNLHIASDMYCDTTNIFVRKTIDGTAHYIKLADQHWVFEALKDFLKGPVKQIADDIWEAMRAAQRAIAIAQDALNRAVVYISIRSYHGTDSAGGVQVGYRTYGGSFIDGGNTGAVFANTGHKHKPTLLLGQGGSLQVTIAENSYNGSSNTVDLSSFVDGRFEAGWAGVTATQVPASKKITITTPAGNKHDYEADKIYDYGYWAGYRAACAALELEKTIDGKVATITASIAAKTQGDYSMPGTTKTKTATAGLKFGDGHTRYTRSEITKPEGCTHEGTCYSTTKDKSTCYHSDDVSATIK